MSKQEVLFVSIIMASIVIVMTIYAMAIKFDIGRLDKRIMQIEQDLGITENFRPQPWMFQPATEPCDPDEDWRCAE